MPRSHINTKHSFLLRQMDRTLRHQWVIMTDFTQRSPNGIFILSRKLVFILFWGTRFVAVASPSKVKSHNATDFCRGKLDGYYANEQNCCRFVQCLHHFAYEKSCPAGLLFNTHLCKCDWQENAKCQVPVPDNPDGRWVNGVYTGCDPKDLPDEMQYEDKNTSEVLQLLTEVTTVQPGKNLTEKELMTTIFILVRLVNEQGQNENAITKTTEDQIRFYQTASNLLAKQNIETWQEIDSKTAPNSVPSRLIHVLDDFGLQTARTLEEHHPSSTLVSDNLAVKIIKLDQTLQKDEEACFEHQGSSICHPPNIFNSSSFHSAVNIIFFSLNQILSLGSPNSSDSAHNMSTNVTWQAVHSTIVSSTVSSRPPAKMNGTVKIRLKNRNPFNAAARRSCVFWRYENPVSTWLSNGCAMIPEESSAEFTVCSCNHLTLFAVLVDPFNVKTSPADKSALMFISTVGCSVSFLALLLTILVTLLFWRKLQSVRTKVLLNLCVSLAAACLLVIIAGSVRNHKVECTVVAVSLHFALLSAFYWMLCEGILLYFITTIPASMHDDKLRYFYLLGWGCPVAIVSVSLAVTRVDGYGSSESCWLAVDGGLIWAFIAPASVVILINVTFLIIVLRKTLSTRLMLTKTQLQRVKGGVKATVVSLPLLGITWVLGLLTFNSETVSFQYAFAVLNSLQGLMIFMFHCALNKKVQRIVVLKVSQVQQRISFSRRVTPVDQRPSLVTSMKSRFGNRSGLSTVTRLVMIPRIALQEDNEDDVNDTMGEKFMPL